MTKHKENEAINRRMVERLQANRAARKQAAHKAANTRREKKLLDKRAEEW